MARLIIVPQYPTRLRYQEWWFTELPKRYEDYFNNVIVLGAKKIDAEGRNGANRTGFAPVQKAIAFEMAQINEYMEMEIYEDDILLLCDISFPGIFANILYHKKPDKCFAICHATSRNTLDYFSPTRYSKWDVETGVSKLFDGIFVATEYHKEKLAWKNTYTVGLPLPPFHYEWEKRTQISKLKRRNNIISTSRDNIQKRNKLIEREITKRLGEEVISPPENMKTWDDYYYFLLESKVVVITSKEETFGYQVLDAICAGCIPIAPARYSYPELLPSLYLYQDTEELINKIKKALSDTTEICAPLKIINKDECENFYIKTASIMLCKEGDK